MNKQKSIGYVRSSQKGATSIEAQKKAIKSYCEARGYELISYYETSTPLVPEQVDHLEAFIRNHLGIHDTTVKLIPDTMSRIGRSINTVQSVIISLHDKRIEIEPVDAAEPAIIEKELDV